MLICRRHRELEQKLIQDAANKRIEELVNKRVEEELEKRKEEIEAEVARRIEEAKKVMEKEMMEELERRRQQLLEEEKKREVQIISVVLECLIRGNCVSFDLYVKNILLISYFVSEFCQCLASRTLFFVAHFF